MDQLDDGTEVRRVRKSTGALYRKDRVSQSGSDTGHVVTGRWGPTSGQWQHRMRSVSFRPDAGAKSDQTLAGCIWSG